MFATPWPLPESTISPKLFNDSSRNVVRSALAAFDASKPVAAAATPPASWYLETSFAQAELLGVFSKSWQLVCRTDQVSQPGSFATSFIGSDPVIAPPFPLLPHLLPLHTLTRQHNATQVVVVHGDDGKVRAFSNVCRHHAARVCDGEGRTDALVCPYHQWTYNLQGRLIKSTRMKGIQDFAASKVRLPELPLEVWGPFVFVLANPAAAAHVPSVAVQLAAIQSDFESSSGWEGGAVPWRSLKVTCDRLTLPIPSISA